jgi:hypothetical protein
MLSVSDPDLNTFATGNFGFQANEGQTAFRNLTISTIPNETITVTDAFPTCAGVPSWVGGGGTGHSFAGNTLTWNVGTLSACSQGLTCTLASTIPCNCTGSFTNVATGSGTGTTAPVSATVNVLGFTLTKSVSPVGPISANGPITFSLKLCTSGSGTLGGYTGLSGSQTIAASAMVTIVDNWIWTSREYYE